MKRKYTVTMTQAEALAATRALSGVVEMSEPGDHPPGVHASSARALRKLRAALQGVPATKASA